MSSDIVIDELKGWTFKNEDQLYEHFRAEIDFFEKDFFTHRSSEDISEKDFAQYERHLSLTLDDPDEIWKDTETLGDKTVFIYLREVELTEDDFVYHMAICYHTGNVPSFVYLHFPTNDPDLVERYCQGEIIYDRSLQDIPLGAMEGDALSESDELALGLYSAMLMVRSDKDIPEQEFPEFYDFREVAVEDADEIWRTSDSMGNVLVYFIRDFPDETDAESELFYIVVTLEDQTSNSHALLFSFPTRDKNLLDRYRHGENLQAEEVVQESSH